MICDEGDVLLASFSPLRPGTYGTAWTHIADRDEFVAVLSGGRPVCLKLHL